MKYWKLKDSCTLFKTAKWRHCKGKSHSGRLQSTVAQDIKLQVTPLPQTSCVTFSRSVSLVNWQKDVSRIVIHLPQDQASCLSELWRQPSLITCGTYQILSLQASPLALCTAKHTWPGSVRLFTIHLRAWTADECTDECAPPILSSLMVNLLSRTTDVQCINESSLIFYCLTCKNILRSRYYFLYLNFHKWPSEWRFLYDLRLVSVLIHNYDYLKHQDQYFWKWQMILGNSDFE